MSIVRWHEIEPRMTLTPQLKNNDAKTKEVYISKYLPRIHSSLQLTADRAHIIIVWCLYARIRHYYLLGPQFPSEISLSSPTLSLSSIQ